MLPDHHFLETWSDDTPRAGVTGIQQPVMTPLLRTRAAADVLLAAARALGKTTGLPEGRSARWCGRRSTRRRSSTAAASRRSSPPRWRWRRARSRPARAAAGSGARAGLPLVVAPTLRHPDGCLAQRPAAGDPRPLSRVSWSGWVELHPATATTLGVETGDVVTLDGRAATSSCPPTSRPASAKGRWRCRSATPWPCSTGTGPSGSGRASRGPTGRERPAPPEEERTSTAARSPAASAAPRRSSRRRAHPLDVPGRRAPRAPLGPGDRSRPLHRLRRVRGRVLRREQQPDRRPARTSRGRDMAWLRIQSFVDETPEGPKASFLPLGCQHCTNAPCEKVCPAYATYHTHEGLNAMVYARCVGTRYCENNCPYSVRRFNFFDSPAQGERPRLGLNPDVTVRERGVTEKCTFCIQRIRAGEEQAKFDGRRRSATARSSRRARHLPDPRHRLRRPQGPRSEISRRAGRRPRLPPARGAQHPAGRRLPRAPQGEGRRERPEDHADRARHARDHVPTSWYYWAGLAVSVSLIALGGWAWSQTLREGLGITGLNDAGDVGLAHHHLRLLHRREPLRARWSRRSSTSPARRCAPRSGAPPRR